MFGLQPWHLIAILAVALIIFGPQRLPEIGKAIGQSIREFREAAEGTQNELRKGLEARPEPKPEPSADPSPQEPGREVPAMASITKTDGDSTS